MNSETKVLGAILIFSVLLIVGGIFLLGKQTPPSTQNSPVQNIDYSLGQKIGTDSAKIKLTEFSDYQCPACLGAKPMVDNILKTYPADVQLIYMDFPLPQHLNARAASTASLVAASEGKFVEMHNKLFDTQEQWADLEAGKAKEFFADLGKQIGVEPGKIREAIDKNSSADKIAASTAEGYKLGVNSTPTFYINGKKVIIKNTFSEVQTAVEEELKK